MKKLFLPLLLLVTACGGRDVESQIPSDSSKPGNDSPQNSDSTKKVPDVTGTTVMPQTDQPLPSGQVVTSAATSIAIISDFNGYAGDATYDADVARVVGEIVKNKYDLVLMPGDLISVETSETASQMRAMWAGFEQAVVKPFYNAHIPFAFAFGNHDTPNALSKSIATEFWASRKNMLGVNFVDDGEFPFRYSFQKNNNLFFTWETNTSKVSADNFTWLNKIFALPQAKSAGFKFGMGHVPGYAITEARNTAGETLSNYKQLQTELENNKVNIYATGHDHAYYPAIKNGVHYLHNGCLGGGQRQIIKSSVSAFKAYSLVVLPASIKEKLVIKGLKAKPNSTKSDEIIPLSTLPKSIVGFDGRTAEIDVP